MRSDIENMEQFFDDSWGHMHELLDEHFPVKEKEKRRVIIWWWTGLSAVCIVGGLAWWYIGFHTFDKIKSVHTDIGKMSAPISRDQPLGKEDTLAKKQLIAKISENSLRHNRIEITNNLLNSSNDENDQKIAKKLIATKLEVSHHDNLEKQTFRKKPQKQMGAIRKNVVGQSKENTNRFQKLDSWNMDSSSIVAKLAMNKEEPLAIKPLPSLPLIPLFAKSAPLKVAISKHSKRAYVELYAGVSMSNLGYSSGFLGGDVGYALTNRLNVELGLGYRSIFIHNVLIDSTNQTIEFDGTSTVKYLSPGSFGSSPTEKILLRNKGNIRIDLIEVPLRILYRITPKWSVYVDGIGGHQFAKAIPAAELLYINYHPKNLRDLVPVAQLSNHKYVGIGGGVSYGQNHWRLTAGYNNWAYFRLDNQYYVGMKYRF